MKFLQTGGGVYLLDFGLLKTEYALRIFAYQYAHCQPEAFTIDYYNSLVAAFPAESFQRLARKYLSGIAKTYLAFPGPYNVAVKSEGRHGWDEGVMDRLAGYARCMSDVQRSDLKGLMMSFRLGGLRSTLLSNSLRRGSYAGQGEVHGVMAVPIPESQNA